MHGFTWETEKTSSLGADRFPLAQHQGEDKVALYSIPMGNLSVRILCAGLKMENMKGKY